MTEAAGLANELRLAVHRLTRRLRAQRPVDGLTLTQLSTLVTIWRDGPMTAGEVAEREGIKPPSATRIIAGLVALGLISRTVDPADARQLSLAATDAGEARIQADLQARDEWLAHELDTFSEADRELLRHAAVVLGELAGR